DGFGEIIRAIQFDDVHPALFDQPDGGAYRFGRAFLQRAVGEVAADQGALDAAPYGLAYDQDFFHGAFERVGMSPLIDAHGVAYRYDVDAGAVDDLCDLIVPGHDPDDFLAVALHLLKGGDSDGGILCLHGWFCLVGNGW